MQLQTKLAHLLPHWIEHNTTHAEQFEHYAHAARTEGLSALAQYIQAAAEAVRKANTELGRACELLPEKEVCRDEKGSLPD
jgi:hypothetical protein